MRVARAMGFVGAGLAVIALSGAGVGCSARRAAAPPLASATADEWTVGSVHLTACEIGKGGLATVRAFCGKVEVPEDWDATGGRRIGLRVAVVRSRAAVAEPDWVTFLDGGPGGAAIDDYPGLAGAFHDMRERRHLLLVDQRGTGGSNELRCSKPDDAADADDEAAKRDRERAQRSAMNEVEGGLTKEAREELHRSLRECLDKLKGRADPAQYTTQAAVRDLEAVRQALGGPPLDLVGVSYGTRMAQQYAATWPTAVRAVVLDSPVPNELILGSETSMNLDAALKARFEVCRKTPACAARFGDPYAALYRLRDRLREHPERVTVRDPVTFARLELPVTAADLAVTARLFAYRPQLAALLPLTIDEAEHGHYAPLLGQRKLITDALTEQLTDGMGLSVSCADDADLMTPRPQDRALLLGDAMTEYIRAACEVWPRGRRAKTLHEPFRSELPTLILAGEFDPITPPRYGEAVKRGLSRARLLVARGQGHGLLEVGCMPRLLGEFVRAPSAPFSGGREAFDASCLDAVGDTPAFIGYAGAAP